VETVPLRFRGLHGHQISWEPGRRQAPLEEAARAYTAGDTRGAITWTDQASNTSGPPVAKAGIPQGAGVRQADTRSGSGSSGEKEGARALGVWPPRPRHGDAIANDPVVPTAGGLRDEVRNEPREQVANRRRNCREGDGQPRRRRRARWRISMVGRREAGRSRSARRSPTLPPAKSGPGPALAAECEAIRVDARLVLVISVVAEQLSDFAVIALPRRTRRP